jgi:hypothetical protein
MTEKVIVLEKLDASVFDNLLQLLQKITIPKKTSTNNRRGFPRHRAITFGYTKARFTGIQGLSYYSKKYPEIYKEIITIGDIINNIQFKSIHLNYNVICPPHTDNKNIGNSILVSFGDYQGCNIVIDNVVYDAKHNPILFDGSKLEHYNTNDLIGTKYSLVFFNNI